MGSRNPLPGASPVNVRISAHLFKFPGKPCRYAPRPTPLTSSALDPANDAPCPMPMGQSQRHSLGAVLSDSVVVMLIDLAHVGLGQQQAAEKGLSGPLPYGRGSVSRCKYRATLLSRARKQAVFGLFPQPAGGTRYSGLVPGPSISAAQSKTGYSAIANKCFAPRTSSKSPASAGVASTASPMGFLESNSYCAPAFTT